MARSIDVDDEVYDHLKDLAEPFVDSPNSVLRRILELDGDGPAVPQPRGYGRSMKRDARSKRSESPGRVRKRKARSTPSRAPKGVLLPGTEYETPILAVLSDLGGRAPTSEVLTALEPRIKDRLMPADFDPLDGSGLIRWKNRAQFARLQLVRSGDMKKESPRGVWEISDQGRKRLQTETA